MTGTDQKHGEIPQMPAGWLTDWLARSPRPYAEPRPVNRRPATFARVVRRRKRRVRDAQRLEVDRRAVELGRVSQGVVALVRVPAAVAVGGESRSNVGALRAPRTSQTSSPLCLLAQRALVALGGRAIADGCVYRLDGAVATLADLVVAARAAGVVLSYPGIRPHATAFHSGPSAALPPRPRRDVATPRITKKRRENHHAEDHDLAGATPRR